MENMKKNIQIIFANNNLLFAIMFDCYYNKEFNQMIRLETSDNILLVSKCKIPFLYIKFACELKFC